MKIAWRKIAVAGIIEYNIHIYLLSSILTLFFTVNEGVLGFTGGHAVSRLRNHGDVVIPILQVSAVSGMKFILYP